MAAPDMVTRVPSTPPRTPVKPAAASAVAARGSNHELSSRESKDMVETLEQMNGWTPGRMTSSPPHPELQKCCIVREYPRCRDGAVSSFYWGKDRDGYPLISRRINGGKMSRAAKRAAKTCPIRIGRALRRISKGGRMLHTCNAPACVARYHIVEGTQQQNMQQRADQHRDRPPQPMVVMMRRSPRLSVNTPSPSPRTGAASGGRWIQHGAGTEPRDSVLPARCGAP